MTAPSRARCTIPRRCRASGDSPGGNGRRTSAECASRCFAPTTVPAYIDADVVRAATRPSRCCATQGATMVEVPSHRVRRHRRDAWPPPAAEAYAPPRHRGGQHDDGSWGARHPGRQGGIAASVFIGGGGDAMHAAQAAFAQWMRGWDALLTPTLPITAKATTRSTRPLRRSPRLRARDYSALRALAAPRSSV